MKIRLLRVGTSVRVGTKEVFSSVDNSRYDIEYNEDTQVFKISDRLTKDICYTSWTNVVYCNPLEEEEVVTKVNKPVIEDKSVKIGKPSIQQYLESGNTDGKA